MFIISYKVPKNQVDEKVELLQINDIFDVYYESPLEIIKDNWGYDYKEKDDVTLDLNIAFYGAEEELQQFIETTTQILDNKNYSVKEENFDYETVAFPAVHIDENWVLASPDEEFPEKNKINFISQGAFGTGLHETTQDILRFILNTDFSNKSVLDIGTGSGILSLAVAIKGASNITALDIRDVKDEIEYNSSLNNLTNIEVLVGDALTGEVEVKGEYDWVFINIGGEETKMFMNFINNHIKPNGKLLVSGLVEWSFDDVKTNVEQHGYKFLEKHQTNEWCTMILDKIN